MGSYKSIAMKSTVSDAISDAVLALTELGEECREIVDNAGDNLANTSRIQTLDETASALEEVQEPDVPELAGSIEINYHQEVNKNKRRGCSRAVRCQNAIGALESAKSAVEEKVSELEDEINSREKEPEGDDELTDDKDAAQELIDALEEIISSCESLEFPGMFG